MVKRGEGLSRRAEYRNVLCDSSASVDAMTRRVHDVQSRYETAGSAAAAFAQFEDVLLVSLFFFDTIFVGPRSQPSKKNVSNKGAQR